MNTDDLYSDNLGSQLNQFGSIASDSLDAAMDTDTLEMDGQGADVQDTVDDQEEDDEEFLEDDLSILMRAWVNERNAPDLLEYEGTTIENLMELVDFQTQKIKSQPPMIANIIKVDVDRVKYLVRSYLRTRLAKIEQHAMHYTRDDMYKERMSQNELEYAKGSVSTRIGAVQLEPMRLFILNMYFL
ncbi:GINS complex subunit [Coemansia sp. RSA 520]|nr:GINS complex subunit [Coemansia sp. RSA 522]KAJ2218606.1 GINS complex subunit [Coemansia sp. RSA 520]KAJ2442183.1 GINS complex subunit [Coemansia sp. RSA 2440]